MDWHMGKTDNIIQLRLPFDKNWWKKSEALKDHWQVSTIARPTEDAAFESLYNQSKLLSGQSTIRLDPIQYKVYMLELRAFRELPRYANEADRRNFIIQKTGMGEQAVKDILASIDSAAFWQTFLDEQNRQYRALVKEVLTERFQLELPLPKAA